MEVSELNVSSATTSEEPSLSYRQRLEKPAGGDVVLMKWSPTMDLLAATFADNSVVVNRLSWQRVWTIPGKEIKPTSLAWRPDGKILAVGRSNGTITLHNVEGGKCLHTHTFPSQITSLYWMIQDKDCIDSDNYVHYKDRSLSFLPPLPSLDSSDTVDLATHSLDMNTILPQCKEMDVLLVGDQSGILHVCINGMLCVTGVSVRPSPSKVTAEEEEEEGCSHVIVTRLSGDLKLLTTLVQIRGAISSSLHVKTLEVELMKERCRELQQLAIHYSNITSLLEYTSDTLRCMHESWEDILLMVDTKLVQYSSTLKEGTSVADELLILLACGKARPELREFLLDELTSKGVKKAGLSLETSYTRVRKYSLTCLTSVIQALQFHLGEVLSRAKLRERFGPLGVSIDSLQGCVKSLGTFALKNQELQLVIDESLMSIKSFFTWLYIVIVKLEKDPVPPNMKQQLDAKELNLLVQFLKKRLTKSTKTTTSVKSFNMEVVGQYLVDEDLKIVQDGPLSLWEKIMREADLDSKDLPWLITRSSKKSLLQLMKSLVDDVSTAFASTKDCISKTFSHKKILPLLQNTSEISSLNTKVGVVVCEGEDCVFYPCNDGELVLVVSNGGGRAGEGGGGGGGGDRKNETRCCKICIKNVPGLLDQEKRDEPLSLLSIQPYSEEVLSLLIQYHSTERRDVTYDAVAQLPVKPLLELATSHFEEDNISCCESQDVGGLLTQVHSLGPFHAAGMAVSGPRRLAAVFSCRTKKIRLFDVDAEEEEEEEED